MSLYTLTIDLLANTGSLERDMGKAARLTEKATRDIKRALSEDISDGAKAATKAVEGMGVNINRALAGIGAGAVFGMFIKETVNAQNELAQLQAVLKSTGQAAGFNSRQLTDMAGQMAKATTHSTGEIINAQTRLLSYSGIVGKEFPRALQLAIDQSVRLGESLTQSAETVGKALEYPAQGVSALTKQGFRFTEEQKKMLKVMEETGRLAEAQALVMEVMEESYKGAAAAARDTLGGALAQVGKSFKDLLGEGSDSAGIKAATAAVNSFANNIGFATVVLGGFAAVKASEAVINRTRAITAGMAVERASTKETLLAAQVLERRARVAMLDAQAEARRAQGTAVQTVMTLQAKEAEMAYSRAVLMTAAAQKQATAAAAGLGRRGLQAISGLLGGPWGVAAMVATTAAGWLLFRDNTDAATRSLDRMNGSLSEAIANHRELDQLRQAGAIAAMADKVADAADEVREEVAQMMRDVRQILASEVSEGGDVTFLFGKEARDAVYQYMAGLEKLTAEYSAGEITARQFNDQVQAQKEQLLQSEEVARAMSDTLARQGSEVGEATTKHQELTDKLAAMQGKMTDAEIAARGLASGVRDVADAANIDFSKVDKMLDSLMAQASSRYAEVTLGKAGVDKQSFEQMLLQEGINPASDEARARRARLQAAAGMNAAADAASEAAKGSKKQQDDAKKVADQRRESMARYDKQAALAAATLAGPLQAAEMAHTQRLAEIDAELKKGNMSQAAANVLKDEATAALGKSTAALIEQQNAPNALLDTMTGEIRLLGMTGRARELYRRQLENERDMREAINRANEAGAGINDSVTDSLLRQARGWAETSIAAEEAAAAAEDWTRVAMSAVGGVADVFADLFSGQLKSAKDFFTSLKDVFKRGLWDVMRNMMQTNFVAPMQKALESAMSGFGNAGTSGQGFGGVLSKVFSSWLGQGAGAANVATTGYGQAINGLASTYGGTGVGTTAGAGMMGMGAAIPIAGAIIAGMTLNNSAYAQGFKIQGQTNNVSEYLTKNGHAILALAHSTVSVTDKMLQKIGLSSKTASMISGSSLSTKAFGHAAPKIQQSGIQGSIGFGGLEGESFADIKAKGGWFRSDKRWTETGELNPDIDRAFDMAAARAGVGAKELAKQVGVDVAQGLGAVKIDLGKMVLDADPEKAREQVEAKLSEIMEGLTGEAVKALGFGKLLEPAYAATDVMTALSAAMELSRTTAEALGRAINDTERAGIERAVGWFKELSQINGTEMADEIARVVGIVGDYGSLMADIDTQLMTGGLSNYQQQALAIERAYRQQAKAANDYAKALGLSGARAEDLAKIEELRAVGMGKLQAQMEAEKAASLNNLALSDLSPLRDDQKLAEAMRQLQDAVTAGDIGAANSASQAALGFGRNLYASGRDYSSLYEQVTGMLGGMQMGGLDLEDGTTMGALADTIEALPEQFGKAIFELAAGMQKETTAATNEVRDAVNRSNDLLDQLLQETRRGVGGSSAGRLRDELNGQQVRAR